MRIFLALVSFLFFLVPFKGTGQMNLPQKYFKLVAGDTLSDVIYSSVTPTVLVTVDGLEVPTPVNIGENRYVITVRPILGVESLFKGKAVIPFQYFFNNKPYFITYNLDYGTSVINCQDDYKSYLSTDTIIVEPLINDLSTTTGLKIAGIGNISGGQVSFTDSTISFTPDSSVRKGFVLYSVRDDAGSTSNALIHFIRESQPESTTLQFTLINTQNQVFYLPAAGYNILKEPVKGEVHFKEGCTICFEYDPNPGVSGKDTIRFSDADENFITVVFNIINKAHNTTSVRDDIVFTPRNIPVSFNVLDNDLTNTFPISFISPGLTANPEVAGLLTYSPPASFQGLKKFKYRVNYGTHTAEGNIEVYVGNYQPQQDLVYRFRTLANTPLLLEYNVPIMGYDFELLSEPIFGNVEISGDSLFMECDTFATEKVYINYTPYDEPGIENDEFDIKYYLTNGDTFIYKIFVDIISPDEGIDCPCITPDCVRKGDLNADGRVSVSDIIPLARFNGFSGIERTDHAHSDEVGTYSQEWGMVQPSGMDIKHIDANGDGLISVEDTSSVDYNYGKLHSLVPKEVLAVKDVPFTFIPNKESYVPGDTMLVHFSMGTPQKPALNIFAFTFNINFSSNLIDSSSVQVVFDNTSWFSYSSPSLNFWRQPKRGKLDIAHAITGGIVEDEVEGFRPKGSTGFGNLGTITAIVEDEVEGFKGVKNTAAPKQALHNTENRAKGLAQGDNYSDSYTTKTIRIENIVIEDIYGERFMVPDTFIQVKIITKGSIPQPTEAQLLVFPNPANDVVHVHFNGRNLIYDLKIFNSQGQEIQQITQVLQQHISLDTHQWAPGMYVIQVQSQQGIINKKVIIH
jgi:hypothetical protein